MVILALTECQRSVFNYLKTNKQTNGKTKKQFTSSFIEACYLTLAVFKKRSFKNKFQTMLFVIFHSHVPKKYNTSIVLNKDNANDYKNFDADFLIYAAIK